MDSLGQKSKASTILEFEVPGFLMKGCGISFGCIPFVFPFDQRFEAI